MGAGCGTAGTAGERRAAEEEAFRGPPSTRGTLGGGLPKVSASGCCRAPGEDDDGVYGTFFEPLRLPSGAAAAASGEEREEGRLFLAAGGSSL